MVRGGAVKVIFPGLLGRLRPVSLTLGATLHEQEGRIEYVYFVSEGVVSHVTHMGDGGSVEVGLVGSEGMVGLPVALGDDVSPNHAIVQLEGGAMRTEAAALREELGRGGRLQSLLLRYTLASNKQTAQTAACNRSHNLGSRLARWLLMCHDRVEGDELELTQEFISQMLGTRRSGVSEAAILLQAGGLIRYSRGHITILDRGGWRGSPASATRSSGRSSNACSASSRLSKQVPPPAVIPENGRRASSPLLLLAPLAALNQGRGRAPGCAM